MVRAAAVRTGEESNVEPRTGMNEREEERPPACIFARHFNLKQIDLHYLLPRGDSAYTHAESFITDIVTTNLCFLHTSMHGHTTH